MKKLSFILFVLFASNSFSQTINWQPMHDWKVYDLRDKKGMRKPVDSLKYFRGNALDDDSVKYFFNSVAEIIHGDEPVWMGAIILSCIDTSGIFRKIDVSVYGGFFYDEKTRKYFQVRDDVKAEWLEYLERQSKWPDK